MTRKCVVCNESYTKGSKKRFHSYVQYLILLIVIYVGLC